jgi:hypothetical protein
MHARSRTAPTIRITKMLIQLPSDPLA